MVDVDRLLPVNLPVDLLTAESLVAFSLESEFHIYYVLCVCSFPIMAKCDVNGPNTSPVYQ